MDNNTPVRNVSNYEGGQWITIRRCVSLVSSKAAAHAVSASLRSWLVV